MRDENHPITLGDLTRKDGPFLYGSTGVTRGLQEQIDIFYRMPQLNLNEELQQARSVLCIGVGRGKILFDLIRLYPNLEDIRGISREDFLYSALDLQQGIRDANSDDTLLTLNEEEAVSIAQRMHDNHTVADVTEGIPMENQSFDTVIVGVAVADYIHHKARFLSEIKRVLKPNGMGIVELTGMRILPQGETDPNAQNMTAQFFESMEGDYTYIPATATCGLLVIRNNHPEQVDLNLTMVGAYYDDLIGPRALIYREYYRPSMLDDENQPDPVYHYGIL